MSDTPRGTRSGESQAPGEAPCAQPARSLTPDARRRYEPPRVSLRGSVASGTLVSGTECNFDPPPC